MDLHLTVRAGACQTRDLMRARSVSISFFDSNSPSEGKQSFGPSAAVAASRLTCRSGSWSVSLSHRQLSETDQPKRSKKPSLSPRHQRVTAHRKNMPPFHASDLAPLTTYYNPTSVGYYLCFNDPDLVLTTRLYNPIAAAFRLR